MSVEGIQDVSAVKGAIPAEYEDAMGGQFPPVLIRPAVLHLLWTGVLRAGLEQPLNSNTALDVAALAAAARPPRGRPGRRGTQL